MTVIAANARKLQVEEQRKEQTLAITYQRLMLVMLVFAGVIALIALRLVYLQIFTDRVQVSVGNPLLPPRGDIVDRNGVPLARTIDAWSIGVHPNKLLGDPDELATKLAELMPEKSAAEYKALLTSGKTFVYLSRRAMPELVSAVNALGEPAIAFDREPERLYPQTALAAHILGWTDFEGQGVTGMEKVLNDRLGNPDTRGQGVALSIDSRVQAAVESELGAAMAKHSAEGGTGIVLDVQTGEILAMASFPTFNPNAAGKYAPNSQYNRATMGVYELGSTFKPLTVATAIDAGTVTSFAKRYDAGTPLAIGRFRISDYKGKNRPLNVAEVIAYSSNIGTARIADEMGAERLQASFRKLGFDSAPHIELAEKAKPLWPREWSRATLLTSSFGHGVAITPLHLATAYAALVNGGIWRPSTLLKVDPSRVPEGRRVFEAETSRRVRQLLRLNVLHGGGKRGEAAGYRVGGKTGTAEKSGSGGYSKKVNVSTFAAAFPMDNPRYVVIAMLDAPKATADTFGYTTAGWVSAPIVSKVIARTGSLLGVIPDERRDMELSEVLPLVDTSGD
ncbi:MAG TPA: penicillin-binding protein 2 [Allosphingosinicella sp.]|uniref:peptidoglycan D,D-transpeptidase FtsI family protein n=1 Tax=Allosphingosinicella sp. TaxID=2823234 RepID=UPI002ED7C76C